MPTEALISARPVVQIDGATVAGLTDDLLELRIHEGLECPATLELRVGNWGSPPGGGAGPDFRYLDRRELDFGKRITVAFSDLVAFSGQITALEAVFDPGAAPTLVVLAEDALQGLRLTRRTRTFTDVTDADVVRQVAGEHGLTGDVDLPGPTHVSLTQLDQSDLAFLRDRVRAVGGELWADDRTLKARRRPDRQEAPRPLRLYGELREMRVRADLAHQATAVVVGGWDVTAGAAIAERAGDAALGAEGQGGETGSRLLQRAFGDRVQTVVAAPSATPADARERAEAIFRARARRFVRGWGVCGVDPRVRVGARVELSGIGRPFSGEYGVVEIVHRFDGAAGARTELTVERAVLAT